MFEVSVSPDFVYGGSIEQSSFESNEQTPTEYKTEFHRAYGEFITDLKFFRDRYPLTTLISIVVFGILGFFNVLSIFSPTAMIAGALLLGLATSLSLSIGKDPSGFKDVLLASLYKVKDAVFTGEEKGQEEARTRVDQPE